MRDKYFVDTNVFVYALLEDEKEKEKHEKAVNVLKELSNSDTIINTQVVNELFNVMLKNKVFIETAQQKIRTIVDKFGCKDMKFKTIEKAWEVKERYGFSYWDSLIIASALENHCDYLYSEDMQNGQIIEKTLKIVNPF